MTALWQAVCLLISREANNDTINKPAPSTIARGTYNEILLNSLNSASRKQVETLVAGAANAAKVDEHGTWNFEADFDMKGRGSALNWDLYGISRDYHSKRTLIVIQVRQYVKRSKNFFPDIKKSYFLIGRNEDDSIFAHPVSAHTVQAAARAGKDVVRAVQNWIFGTDYTRVIRQGDISLIPLKSNSVLKNAELAASRVTMQGSHVLEADEAKSLGDHFYAKNVSLYHTPKTHPDFENLSGWYKVVVGRRSDFYDFAAPTID